LLFLAARTSRSMMISYWHDNNNNDNNTDNTFCIAPLGRNFRGAGKVDLLLFIRSREVS